MKTVRIDDITYDIDWNGDDIWLEPQVEVPDWILLWKGGALDLLNKYYSVKTFLTYIEYRYDTIESFVFDNKDQFIKIQQS